MYHRLQPLPALLLVAMPLPCQVVAADCDAPAKNNRGPRLQWDAAAYAAEGERFEQLGRDDCAIRLYVRAVELDPEAWNAT